MVAADYITESDFDVVEKLGKTSRPSQRRRPIGTFCRTLQLETHRGNLVKAERRALTPELVTDPFCGLIVTLFQCAKGIRDIRALV